jgi:putative endonuclease
VAARRGVVVFVEVKTRRGRHHGGPSAAVDPRKQARLVQGARAWLRAQPRRFHRARFDVIACELDPRGRWRICHLEGAFDAGGAGCH